MPALAIDICRTYPPKVVVWSTANPDREAAVEFDPKKPGDFERAIGLAYQTIGVNLNQQHVEFSANNCRCDPNFRSIFF